jgi:heme A synthase
MEIFTFTLQIHLIGATLLALLLLFTVGLLYRSTSRAITYKSIAIALAGTTLVEIFTGCAMYFLAPESSLLSLCSKMAIYISLTAVAEYSLIQKLRSLPLADIQA